MGMVIALLNVLCVALVTITAVLYALQDKWVLTALWSVLALCWVAVGISNYKMREH